MATDKKISELTPIPSVTGAAEIATERGGANYKVTIDELKTFIGGSTSNVFESNNITFLNAGAGDYFGKYAAARTGTLTFDATDAVTGAISIIYYNNATLDIDITPEFLSGAFVSGQINKIYVERDADGIYSMNIIQEDMIMFYTLKFSEATELFGITVLPTGLTSGMYVEARIRFDDFVGFQTIFANDTSENTYNILFSQTVVRSSVNGGAGVNLTISSLNASQWYTIRFVNNGVNTEVFIDSISQGVTNIAADAANSFFRQIGRRGSAIQATDNNFWLDGEIEYIDYNGDIIRFENTSGSHLSASGDLVLNIASGNGTPIAPLYTLI